LDLIFRLEDAAVRAARASPVRQENRSPGATAGSVTSDARGETENLKRVRSVGREFLNCFAVDCRLDIGVAGLQDWGLIRIDVNSVGLTADRQFDVQVSWRLGSKV